MQATAALPSQHAAAAHGTSVTRVARAFGANIRRWRERSVTRRAMLQLDARTLHDVGITRAEALREARKHFWQA